MVREMRSTARISSRSTYVAALKAVFLAVPLLTALIFGCLAMSGLNVQQTTPVAGATVAASAIQADVVSSGTPALHASSQTNVMSCANCEPNGTHLGLVAVACVLALLALSIRLFVPDGLVLSLLRVVRGRPSYQSITNLRPRTPSLDVLCISRT